MLSCSSPCPCSVLCSQGIEARWSQEHPDRPIRIGCAILAINGWLWRSDTPMCLVCCACFSRAVVLRGLAYPLCREYQIEPMLEQLHMSCKLAARRSNMMPQLHIRESSSRDVKEAVESRVWLSCRVPSNWTEELVITCELTANQQQTLQRSLQKTAARLPAHHGQRTVVDQWTLFCCIAVASWVLSLEKGKCN